MSFVITVAIAAAEFDDREAIAATMSEWVLYVAGHPIPGFNPTSVSLLQSTSDTEQIAARFELVYSHEPDAIWRALDQRILEVGRAVEVSVGPAVGPPIANPAAVSFQFTLRNAANLWLALLAVTLLAFVIFIAAGKTGFLSEPAGPAGGEPKGRRLSLSRVQMAIWFIVVLGCYCFLVLVTRTWEGLVTEQAIALMGIAAATAVGAGAIQHEKTRSTTTSIADAKAAGEQISIIETAIEAQQALVQGTESPALATLVAQRGEAATAVARAHANVVARARVGRVEPRLRDLIYDDDGPALHRLQILVWTFVIAAIFVRSVIRDLQMPQLDGTLLTLMGLSAGTYLGLKIPGSR